MWVTQKIRNKFNLKKEDIVDICPFRPYYCKNFYLDGLKYKWMKNLFGQIFHFQIQENEFQKQCWNFAEAEA